MSARKTVIKRIIVGRPIKNVDPTSVGNASELASNPASFYLDYNNFTNTPNVLDSADVTLIAQSAGTDSNEIIGIVDSAYINARLDTTLFLDSAEAIALIDSAYILARASNIQNLRDSGSDTIITGALLPATDSAQDIGSPTRKFKDLYLSGNTLYIGNVAIGTDDSNNVQIFQLDGAGNIQSTQGKIALVDSAEPTQDVRSIIDSDYINLRLDNALFLDSNEVITLVDSNYVAARTFTQSDIEGFARAVSLDSAEALALIDSNYIKNFARQVSIDSAEAIALIDSAYVNARLDASLFLDSAEVIQLVDSDYVAARTFTQSDIEGFAQGVSLDSAEAIALIDSSYVNARLDTSLFLDSAEAKVMIDSAVNALIDGAPGALDTLNELAAALNDDSNAYGTLTDLINSKLTATQFDTLFDSALGAKTTDNLAEGDNLYYTTARGDSDTLVLIDSAYITARASTFDSDAAVALIDSNYIQSRQTSGTDSAEVEAIAAALIDSNYVAARQSAGVLKLGNVTDGALTDGAIQTLTSDTKIVDAIDELNEAMLNVSNNTFVRGNTFVGSPLAGGQGISVTLNITVDGNANRFDVDWGDGNQDNNITDNTPTHTYSSNTGSPFTVTVRAYNTGGSGSGSEATFVRTGYIIIYTADPVANYNVYAAPTGGSPITFWQDGDTVYFENTTTNTTMADVTYRWTWGDGSATEDVDSDGAAGGVTGDRISHAFALSTETDVQRSPQVEILTHTTADPAVISGGVDYDDTFEILDSHSPSLTVSGNPFGINTPSGLTKTFTNTSEAGIGSYGTYSNQYRWIWGDGTSNQTVNAGSNSSGDRNTTINHTFNLPDSDQTNGHVRDYDTTLSLLSNHTSSPFVSSSQTITMVPEVRAQVSNAQAVVISDASGDDEFDIYDGTDYQGNDRLAVQLTANSHHADSAHTLRWYNETPFNITNGSTENHTFDSADHSNGDTITSTVTATGTLYPDPGVGSQTDTENISWSYHAFPSPAPDTIANEELTYSSSTEGTNPALCAGVPNSSGFGVNVAGLELDGTFDNSLNYSGVRTVSGNSFTTNYISNFRIPVAGEIRGELNLGNDFSDVVSVNGYSNYGSLSSQTGSLGYLNVSSQRDYHDVNSSYPSGFYRVATARIQNVATNTLSQGQNFLAIHTRNASSSNHEGNPPSSPSEITSRYAFILRDFNNGTPSFGQDAATSESNLLVNSSGTGYRYIGGQPYFKDGSIKLQNNRAWRITTYAYRSTDDPIEIERNGNLEGTSGSGFSDVTYSYSDILEASDLTSGIPNHSIGTSSNYEVSDLIVPITSSNVRSVEDGITLRHNNVNGTSTQVLDKPIRVYTTNSIAGMDETDITSSVPNKNGNGVRVTGFASSTSDTPSYTGSTNFYTSNAVSHSVDPSFSSTQEAGVSIAGLIEHNITNYSGHLPPGQNRTSITGNQYFTFAFRSTALQNFNIDLTSSTGITGLYIALPGTGIDTSSTLNGWLDCSGIYNGSGQPGAGTGGNGSNGCAFSGETVPTGSAINNQSYSMTFGTLSAAGSTGNVVLVRLVLASNQSVSNIGVSQFS